MFVSMCVCLYEDACIGTMPTSYYCRPVCPTGELGKYVFRVTSDRNEVNYGQKCLKWFAAETKRKALLQFYWSLTLVCPCDRSHANTDTRWHLRNLGLDAGISNINCIYEKTPLALSAQVPTTVHNTLILM